MIGIVFSSSRSWCYSRKLAYMISWCYLAIYHSRLLCCHPCCPTSLPACFGYVEGFCAERECSFPFVHWEWVRSHCMLSKLEIKPQAHIITWSGWCLACGSAHMLIADLTRLSCYQLESPAVIWAESYLGHPPLNELFLSATLRASAYES